MISLENIGKDSSDFVESITVYLRNGLENPCSVYSIKNFFLPEELVTTVRVIRILITVLDMIQWHIFDCDIFAMKLRLENFGLTALTQLGLKFWFEVALVLSKILLKN